MAMPGPPSAPRRGRPRSKEPARGLMLSLTEARKSRLYALAAKLTAPGDPVNVSEAVRRIIHKLVATKAPAADLSHLADVLEGVADQFAPYPRGRAYEGFAESANAGNPHAFFDNSPILGRANPLAPPITPEASPAP